MVRKGVAKIGQSEIPLSNIEYTCKVILAGNPLCEVCSGICHVYTMQIGLAELSVPPLNAVLWWGRGWRAIWWVGFNKLSHLPVPVSTTFVFACFGQVSLRRQMVGVLWCGITRRDLSCVLLSVSPSSWVFGGGEFLAFVAWAVRLDVAGHWWLWMWRRFSHVYLEPVFWKDNFDGCTQSDLLVKVMVSGSHL